MITLVLKVTSRHLTFFTIPLLIKIHLGYFIKITMEIDKRI